MMDRQRQQLKFTDISLLQAWEQKHLVPEDSFCFALSQADDIFKDDLFAGCYASYITLVPRNHLGHFFRNFRQQELA